VELDIVTSAVCIAVLQFQLTSIYLAFVVNFNFIFSIGQRLQARRYKMSHLQQYLPVGGKPLRSFFQLKTNIFRQHATEYVNHRIQAQTIYRACS
jgi:hypothetical protein